MTEQQQLNEWINGYAYILEYGWNALKYSKQYFNIGFQICFTFFSIKFLFYYSFISTLYFYKQKNISTFIKR